MEFQTRKYLLPLMLLALFTGCTQLTNITTKKTFPERLQSYKLAILWSDFESASNFMKPGVANTKTIDPDYDQIKVTDYDVKKLVVRDNENTVEQRVEIHYYRVARLIERTITDHQTWEWDPDRKQWYLTSDLPRFQ